MKINVIMPKTVVFLLDFLLYAVGAALSLIVLTNFIDFSVNTFQFVITASLSMSALHSGRRFLYRNNCIKLSDMIIRIIAVTVGQLLVFKVLLPYGFGIFILSYSCMVILSVIIPMLMRSV